MQQEIPFAIKLQEESNSSCSGERHRLSSRESPSLLLWPQRTSLRASFLLCCKDSEGSPVGEKQGTDGGVRGWAPQHAQMCKYQDSNVS